MKDEHAVFLAETDEQLQLLEEGLMGLEQKSYSPEMLQTLFRAAHILKGSAGVLGHKRMVDLTHELESALDDLRKEKIGVSTELIDICMDTVIALRMIRYEIAGEEGVVDITSLVQRFKKLNQTQPSSKTAATGAAPEAKAQVTTRATTRQFTSNPPPCKPAPANKAAITVRADIAKDCVASAARALQMMMVLQEMGEILTMQPSRQQIESAAPVQQFEAQFIPSRPVEEVRKALAAISEIENLVVGKAKAAEAEPAVTKSASPPVSKQVSTYDIPAGTELNLAISEDELPIFVAETAEQLQVLDEGLVLLERETSDPELLQALFRAAHTLKGASGMINHTRMVEVTHNLETALDGLRKDQLDVTPVLIDLCLEAVDVIRTLSGEITRRKASDVKIGPYLARFEALQAGMPGVPVVKGKPGEAAPSFAHPGQVGAKQFLIQAAISPRSIASAARALQIVLALRELGEIIQMEPTQEHVDRAAPVPFFKAQVSTNQTADDIRRALSLIDEIDQFMVQEEVPVEVTPRVSPVEGVPAETPRTLQAEPAPISRAAEPSKVAPGPRVSEKITEQTVRTSVERLDNLMNLVGELITDRNRVFQLRNEFENEFRGDERVEQLSATVTHIGRITDQLQAEVMRIRMQPISTVFNKFPRLVRDLARKADKQINLVTRGEDTELDRTVIEKISDPLIHLLRNSVGHGVEPPDQRLANGKPAEGTIMMTAHHEEGHIVLIVEDDGAGIDVERIKAKAVERGLLTASKAAVLPHDDAIELIFTSGLSTATKVTDISGRGVGMDIVRNNIEQLNGSILVDTWPGRGTKFQIILPLTLAIVPTLLVKVGSINFAVPLAPVTQTLRIPKSQIKTVNQKPVIMLRGNVLSLTRLTEVFDFPSSTEDQETACVVVVRWGKSMLGLIVDDLIGQQELVVKSLGSLPGKTPGVSSAAILGDGQVSLIVDVKGLFTLTGVSHKHELASAGSGIL
jgi:two-component system chemotaxis sensor kinase CheA